MKCREAYYAQTGIYVWCKYKSDIKASKSFKLNWNFDYAKWVFFFKIKHANHPNSSVTTGYYAKTKRFHGKPPVKPVDLSCNWFKACREMQYKKRVPHPYPLKLASGVVKYQCCRTTITNYLVGCSAVDRKVSAGETEALPCVRNRKLSVLPFVLVQFSTNHSDLRLLKVWTREFEVQINPSWICDICLLFHAFHTTNFC